MKIRTSQPKSNKYYIRQVSGGLNGAVAGEPTIKGANVLCNCVGYANGRFNEIIGDPELKGTVKAFKYQLVCNAENFIESAKKQGLKISSRPVKGGIMVWQKGRTLSGGDGAGHVEVVEEVYTDGSVLCSSSGWHGWAFRTLKRNNSNGRWGQASGYKYRGCIINPYVDGKPVEEKLVVDGVGGTATVYRLQEFLNSPQDGIIGGQKKEHAKYRKALTAVKNGSGGSQCVRKLQAWIGVKQDGGWGADTSKALQKKLGVTQDGYFGANSMKAFQKYLNEHEKPDDPTPSKTDLKVIDISEFQKPIDWAKAKADGVKGAIIRCGYRGAEKGTLNTDERFFSHISGAHNAGVPVGIYMFTEGINAAEGREEADYAVSLWKQAGVPLSFPIAVDTENVFYTKNGKKIAGRANGLSKAKRTEVIKAFCDRIKELGYEPMIYASTSWLNGKLDMSKLPYKVWCAQYYSRCEYKGEYIIWQYTSTGKVNGISGNVDLNHCYIEPKPYSPEPTPEPIPDPTPEPAPTPTNTMQAWLNAMVNQFNWSKDQKYKFNENPTVANSKIEGTCITFPAVSLQRIGLLPKGKFFYFYPETKKIAGNGASYVKKHPEVFQLSYPNKTITALGSAIQVGDIIGFDNPAYHTMVYMGKNSKGEPIFNTMGHKKGLKVTYASYAKRKVNMLVRLNLQAAPPTPEEQGYQGTFPSYKLTKSNDKVKSDACEWAKKIAANNDFHYGKKPASQHNGCFYCGTQPKSKQKAGIKMWQTTYCCNPFVGAAWAHGGGDAQAYKMCHNGTSWDFGKGRGYDASKLFDNLGHPAKSKLQAGDVLCRDNHVALYIGGGKIAEASGGDDNVIHSEKWNKSISVKTLTDANYKKFPRVHRYNSKVDCDRYIMYGEYSDRVKDLQNFLIWYGYKLSVTGFFNKATLQAVIGFQEKELGKGQADGSVGLKTIEAMKAVKK